MRRSFAAARSMRHAGTATLEHWTTSPQDSGGAPASRTPTTSTVACRIKSEATGDVVDQRDAGTQDVRQRLTAELPRETDVAEGDTLTIAGIRYTVVSVPPLLPTNLYREFVIERG